MERRDFLKLIGGSAAGVAVAAASPVTGSRLAAGTAFAALADSPFQYGVASGDPRPLGSLIWTRLTPSDSATPGSRRGRDVDVRWEVARDARFRDLVRHGDATVTTATDHTLKLPVRGLRPGETYFYRFKALGARSRVGTLKTAPAGTDRSVRFGVASCSNYEGGFFSAYRHMAERNDLDFVLHLGDYIYEYGVGKYGPGSDIGREHMPRKEMVSLSDYRLRHSQYKADPDLMELHARAPFITVWDDHEVTNDTWRRGAENHQPEEEGEFLVRRNRAYRSYFEWMPIALPRPRKQPHRIFRSFRFGDMADLYMLDTRQYRSKQSRERKDDPKRTITGDQQMAWLKRRLERSTAKWHLVGNQVMITPLETGEDRPFNVDQWDGYTADRDELLGHLVAKEINNVSFLTGDIHSSWACDVPLDSTTYPATPPAATEFIGTSITSDNLNEIMGSPPRTTSLAAEATVMADNPYIKYVELDSHGYSIVDVDETRIQMDWYYISDREDKDASQRYAEGWMSLDGTNSVVKADEPIPPRP